MVYLQLVRLLFNFNCTIQELKPSVEVDVVRCGLDFNCTIQELKRNESY